MPEITVIGGGITGLTAVYRLQQLLPHASIRLVERDGRLGGKLLTEQCEGYLIEGAADSFLSRKTAAIELCRELGIEGTLNGRHPQFNATFVRHNGQLYPLPSGLSGMIPTNFEALHDSAILSEAGKARLRQEPDLPPAGDIGEESMAQFITRRLGQEAYERLVEPLMSGIYGGDGAELSLQATFPQLRELEQEHGSLIRGLLAQPAATKAAYPPFVSPQTGMGTIVEALTQRLTHVQILTGKQVQAIGKANGRYTVTLENGQTWSADAVILTTPAHATAQLFADLDPDLAQSHAAIPYGSSAIVSLAYEEASLGHPLNGYGYVIPRIAGTDVLACTWSSRKWAGRAPAGKVLVRVYMGRYGRADVLALSDEALIAMAQGELRQTLGITAVPELCRVARWPKAMPQYTLGHLQRVACIEARLRYHPGLFVAGAAYRGVGVPDCIRESNTAATAVASYISTQEVTYVESQKVH